eukprot:scaffold68380_cov16-Tisochrysis_lutea.AAC.2
MCKPESASIARVSWQQRKEQIQLRTSKKAHLEYVCNMHSIVVWHGLHPSLYLTQEACQPARDVTVSTQKGRTGKGSILFKTGRPSYKGATPRSAFLREETDPVSK